MTVWKLLTGSRKRPSLACDLQLLRQFDGRSLVGQWMPPDIHLFGAYKAGGDGLTWMGGPPVVSTRARKLLEPLLGPHAEFLPLLTLKGREYHAVNVVCLADCLDMSQSEVVYSPTDGRPMNIIRYVFRPERVPDAPIFKCTVVPDQEFVTASFVELVVKERLKGFRFADPSANPFRAILHGVSQNVVPGALE